MKVRDIGEFGLIDLIMDNTILDDANVVTGIGDDTAVLRYSSAGNYLLTTTDMMVEGTHFIISPENGKKIGYRAMAANVSDIAAMGGVPTHAVISLGVSPELEVSFIQDIYDGLKACSRVYGINIVGGDTVSTPQTILSVTLLGEVEPDKCLLRSGARPGDAVLVTGSLGDSRAGIDVHLKKPDLDPAVEEYLINRHFYPTPRVNEVRAALCGGTISAADDISDGLASEIHEVASASGVGAVIWYDALPVSGPLLQLSRLTGVDVADYCLFGGEDFEILFTSPPGDVERIAFAVKNATNTNVTVVGKILPENEGISLLRGNELIKLEKKGFDHFARE